MIEIMDRKTTDRKIAFEAVQIVTIGSPTIQRYYINRHGLPKFSNTDIDYNIDLKLNE